MEKTFTIENISFLKRFCIYYIGVSVFVILIIINLIKLQLDFLCLSMFCFFIFFGFPFFSELKKSLQHIVLVTFYDDKIYIEYFHKDILKNITLNINECNIYIRSYPLNRWNIEYYIEIKFKEKSFLINHKLNLDYKYVIEIFETFKNNKNEKIIFDEKYFLDIIRKKILDNS